MTDTKASYTVKPEWIKPKEVPRYFGISRPAVYNLMNNGKIKSISLRERGKASGSRLISYDSLKDYFDKLSAEQNPEPTN